MSFILEALKKSEQQRQQQTTPAKKVSRRTLSLQVGPSGRRRFPWLVAGLLPLMLVCAWLYYPQPDKSQTAPPPVVVRSMAPAPPQAVVTADTELKVTPTETLQQESEEANPALQSAQSQANITVEPSPVPRAPGSPKTTQSVPPQRKLSSTADRKIQTIDAPVETLVITPPEPLPLSEEEFSSSSSRLPLYSELSGELRGRMPAINMSMHFYNSEPNRRLVRISDRLLREGDMVSRGLELVEITQTGVILDFMGKSFELPGSKR